RVYAPVAAWVALCSPPMARPRPAAAGGPPPASTGACAATGRRSRRPPSTDGSRAGGAWDHVWTWEKTPAPLKNSIELAGGSDLPVGIARFGIAGKGPFIGNGLHLIGIAIDQLAIQIAGGRHPFG